MTLTSLIKVWKRRIRGIFSDSKANVFLWTNKDRSTVLQGELMKGDKLYKLTGDLVRVWQPKFASAGRKG